MWTRAIAGGLGALVLAALLAASAAGARPLAFKTEAATERIARAALMDECMPHAVEVDDPYYEERRRFRACGLAGILARGFGSAEAVRGQDVLLRAADGYTRSVKGDQLLLDGAFLAFSDADRAQGGFDPIGRRKLDPAPYYVIWQGEGRNDTSAWPWPFQLVEIEIAPFAQQFPHTVPQGAAPDSAAVRGWQRFRAECFSCHAINGEGGKVGPELNVPQSIVEYRPEAQIRAYIRDPREFRYTTMPAHPHLGEADLDALVAYFTHMKDHKRDPGGPGH